MKFLYIIGFILLTSCGIGKEPVLGVYDITSVLVEDTCGGSTSDSQVESQVWEVAKGGRGYDLIAIDEEGNKQPFADSVEGFHFRGRADAHLFDCTFSVLFDVKMEYEKIGKVSGISDTSLVAECTSNTCHEERSFTGVKR